MTDHVSHQLSGISSNWVELKIRASHEGLEHIMCRNSNAVAVSLKLVSKRDERLYIAAAANNLYHDVQGQRPPFICFH